MKSIEANGLRFSYLEAGSGPLVLLLHGFPDTAQTWSALLPRLAAAGYRAVAPALRGYDPSDLAPDGDYSVLTLAQDMLALATALGEEQFCLVGHDWGASVAYAAANLAPSRVRKLATVSIPHPHAIRPTPALFWRAPHFLLFQFGAVSEWLLSRDDYAYVDHLYAYWSPNWQPPVAEVEQVKQGFRKPGRTRAALGYYRALFGDARDAARQELYRRKTTVPTVAFAGRSDGALDVRLYDRTPEAFAGPYEVVLYDRAGHFLHREEPERFAAKLLGFLV